MNIKIFESIISGTFKNILVLNIIIKDYVMLISHNQITQVGHKCWAPVLTDEALLEPMMETVSLLHRLEDKYNLTGCKAT